MARYKHIDTSPRFLAVDLERQLLPGTFERALNFLIDHQRGAKGSVRKSNRTDIESAKMATSRGVIQGYAQRKSPWGTREWPPWMTATRSSSRHKRTVPARNRNCCCRWPR